MTDVPRVPPHDLDAEAAVLSAVMLDPSAMAKVRDVATPEKYYAERHRRIFEACCELDDEGQPCDVVTVGTWLKARERIAQVGGMAYLTELLNAAPAVANVRKYAETIAKKYAVRQLIAACQTIAAKGYLDYGEELAFFDEAESAVHAAAQTLATGRADTFGSLGAATRAAFTKIAQSKGQGGVTGIRTGLDDLDALVTGLHRGELYVVAGRPGAGKSALAFQIGATIAKGGLGVVGSSLEMPSEQVAMRLVCADARVSSSLTRAGGLQPVHWGRLTTSASAIGRLPYWLDERAGASVANIRAAVRRAEQECARKSIRLGCVIVDYLQLARGTAVQRGRISNREQEIGEISRSMKEIAKEHDVAVVALSQLNRDCEKRADKRPMLSDLRESGSIEQDADAVIFVYRDKMYDAESDKGDVAELIVAKQRQGPLATVEVRFDEATTSFQNLARHEPQYGGTWTPDEDRRAGVDL